MMAASVLLNFANSVDFTPTDPLIGLVRTGASLLSYDLLSVETFSRKDNDRKEQIRKKVAELRNILEDRSLSAADQGERIRLIILLDFNPWRFLKSHPSIEDDDFDAAFPTLKMDFVKDSVQEVFGAENLLLRRFDYNVIFIDDTSDEARSRKYRQAAYHGYGKNITVPGWISTEDVQLNVARDKALAAMGSPDAGSLLTSSPVRTHYDSFKRALDSTIQKVATRLKQVGRDQDFRERASRLDALTTVDEFKKTDYDGELLKIIQQVIGLGAFRFRDCAFFILNHRLNIKTQKSRDGIVLRSLVQLLCTMSDEDYKSQFRPQNDLDFIKLMILEDPDKDEIRTDAMERYRQEIEKFGVQVGGAGWNNPGGKLSGMSWDATQEVTFCEYSPREAHGEGAHAKQNEESKEKSREKEREFKRVRRVPFFLGTGPGDWHWYRRVTQALKECFQLEDDSLGLLTESPTRVPDGDFLRESRTTNFGELETLIDSFPTTDIKSSVDHDRYIAERKKKVQLLQQKGEDMKKELVKLGFRSRLIWIAFLASIAFTLCYAYHFFYEGQQEHLYWIAAGFGAIVLLFVASMAIAHVIVKGKIQVVYREIDMILKGIRELDRKHLESVNRLVADMNTVDAQRKTLSEMKVKYGGWKSHNKKVELWVNFARNIAVLLDQLLVDLGAADDHNGNSMEVRGVTLDDSILMGKPAVVGQIRSQDFYSDMAPQVIICNQNKENTISGVTCFVSHLKFTCVQP